MLLAIRCAIFLPLQRDWAFYDIFLRLFLFLLKEVTESNVIVFTTRVVVRSELSERFLPIFNFDHAFERGFFYGKGKLLV